MYKIGLKLWSINTDYYYDEAKRLYDEGVFDYIELYVVPDTITAIGESAFAGDTKLKEIVIGSNVKAIGSGAFQYCTSLKKVTIMEGVESIGSAAFYFKNLKYNH